MNEVNTIVTSGVGKTPPAACCSDAKRPDDKPLDSSAAPLPGRREPSLGEVLEIIDDIISVPQPEIVIWASATGTGERSGPGNAGAVTPGENENDHEKS